LLNSDSGNEVVTILGVVVSERYKPASKTAGFAIEIGKLAILEG